LSPHRHQPQRAWTKGKRGREESRPKKAPIRRTHVGQDLKYVARLRGSYTKGRGKGSRGRGGQSPGEGTEKKEQKSYPRRRAICPTDANQDVGLSGLVRGAASAMSDEKRATNRPASKLQKGERGVFFRAQQNRSPRPEKGGDILGGLRLLLWRGGKPPSQLMLRKNLV